MNKIKIFSFILMLLLFPVLSFAQIISAQSGGWDEPSTWVGNTIPTSVDNVLISSNHIVNISTSTAECNSISFADTTAQLSLLSGGVLNIYGNFTLASPTHNAFSSWADGAKIRFTGPNKQILSGWNTSTTTMSTTFMEMIVDKSADTVKTAGNDMKFNLGKSLEILNGSFVLTNTDDIQGRNLDGSEATTPTIIVHPNGRFIMYGGASHIGSGTTGTPRPPIGKVTVYGAMTLTTTSTNKINFNGLDIESGGIITLGSGWSTTAYPFNPGTITIKDGGQLINTVNTNMWHSGTTIDLQNGGIYKLTSSAPTFPPILINNGTVWYARNVSSSPIDQALIDSNYYRLEISFANSGAKKNWVLTENRFIQDSLETNNSAELVLSAASPKTLTLNGTLRLTSGILNNSNPNVTFALADNVTISRATGIITNAPLFGSSVNLRYTSTVSDVATGPEVPTANDVLKNLSLVGSKIVYLETNATVNDTLYLYGGTLDNNGSNDDKILTLADDAVIRIGSGNLTVAPNFGSTVNVRYTGTATDIITGFELPTSPSVLKDLQIYTGDKTITLNSDITVNGNLTLSTGIFDNSNYNLSLANTATIRRATAQLTAPPVFGSTINLEYISTVSDVITGFEVPANPNILNNLTLTTTKIVTLGSDMVVNGTITFTNNKLNTGAFKITSRGAIVGAGAGKFIEGNLSIPVSAAGLKKWEIGQNVDYLPMLVNFSSITGSDNITASVRDITIDPPAGPVTPENKVLRRYYRTEKGPGISSFSINSITLSYTDSDVTGAGADENNLKVFYYDGTGWRPLNVVSRDNTQNTITATGLNYFSDIVIAGEDMETLITKGISLVSGWNLVSVPLVADNMSKESLFPNAISAAFAFDNGYVRKDTLKVGTGYWLKYATATTEEITGRRVVVNTIPVKAGWNLIGIYEKDVLASEITTTPLNIITSYFYEYSSGYIRSDILRSGKGYWIKVNQNGWINLPDLKTK